MPAPFGAVSAYVEIPGFERSAALRDMKTRTLLGRLGSVARSRQGVPGEVPGTIGKWLFFGSPSALKSRVVPPILRLWKSIGKETDLNPLPLSREAPPHVLKAFRTFAQRMRLSARDIAEPHFRALLGEELQKPAEAVPIGTINRLYFAMRQRLLVRVQYRRKSDARVVIHDVEPYSFRAGAFYAVDTHDRKTRRFLVERILAVNVLQRHYRPAWPVEAVSRP